MLASGLLIGGAAWLSAVWVGYPAWLAWRAKVAPRPVGGDARVERVVIVCVMRDERERVRRRLEELGRLARGGLEVSVVVVDDGSTDGTGEEARRAVAEGVAGGLTVEVWERSARGKTRALVEVLSEVEADVAVFCDARQRIPEDALVKLLAPFRDPGVGAVSGEVVKGARTLAGWYWRYETWVRRWEGRTGSVIGATGPWHALRREAWPRDGEGPHADGLLLDDVWLPLQAVLRGFRAVVAEGAAVLDVEHEVVVERRKKARTLTGNLQLLWRWPRVVSPVGNPVWGRVMVHKLARLATPAAVGAMAAAPWVGVMAPGPLWGGWAALCVGEVAGLGALLATPRGREALGLLGATVAAWGRAARGDWRW